MSLHAFSTNDTVQKYHMEWLQRLDRRLPEEAHSCRDRLEQGMQEDREICCKAVTGSVPTP